jgi:hypothetical protein
MYYIEQLHHKLPPRPTVGFLFFAKGPMKGPKEFLNILVL